MSKKPQGKTPAPPANAGLFPIWVGGFFAMALAVGLTYLRAWMLEKRSKE
jgi:hypothetical protein